LAILKIHKNANLDFFDSLFGGVDNIGLLGDVLDGEVWPSSQGDI